ncbi:hypothetical protein AB4114_11360 [Paenibacillus sp. 2RAB27]|uniref:hypothetical protein n=1 Tax=Paenibacillus sp. 2RAB27 TaxID=3232991 RepID=UPI003F9A61E4
MFNYVLIISQYYYSRHFFIVKRPSDFLDKAREFAKELMTYKREETSTREMYLGDLDPKYSGDGSRTRFNINDSGDIYLLQSDYANKLMWESWSYKEDSRRESRGFQKKEVTQSIDKHHNYDNVADIVKKYFEIS